MANQTEYHILCLNSGSSSLKFALYQLAGKEETLLAAGAVENVGMLGGKLWVRSEFKKTPAEIPSNFLDYKVAVQAVFDILKQLNFPPPAAAGHRLVHGGAKLIAPVVINNQILDGLKNIISFAPLHLPSEIETIEAVSTRFPGLPQVACFDTAFHRRMPEIAKRLPLPRNLWDDGVQRYGFHGLSYEYILNALGRLAKGRVIIAHLGNGASMAAVYNGQPIDTTMGFTPTGGFMMGTRSGDLDPGVLLYLMREKHYDASQIDDLVNRQSGLLGVSGISSDMKRLLGQSESNPKAKQAIKMFCYQIRKQIGALAAALGGLDTLVFTGGIGEKAATIRANVCHGLKFVGVQVDKQRNEVHAEIISKPESPCKVMVMPTKEDLMIARHTYQIISNK